jgi:hypothetical protein
MAAHDMKLSIWSHISTALARPELDLTLSIADEI